MAGPRPDHTTPCPCPGLPWLSGTQTQVCHLRSGLTALPAAICLRVWQLTQPHPGLVCCLSNRSGQQGVWCQPGQVGRLRATFLGHGQVTSPLPRLGHRAVVWQACRETLGSLVSLRCLDRNGQCGPTGLHYSLFWPLPRRGPSSSATLGFPPHSCHCPPPGDRPDTCQCPWLRPEEWADSAGLLNE